MAFKASSITGAEINPTTVELMTGKYRDLTGNVYARENIKVVTAEGRSFLRRSDENYDLIQMTGTDTYSALSSGSYILSESYLYTLNAYEDYIDHLTDDGVVAVLRFRFYPPRECLRLVAIAAEALKRKGVDDPSRNILVVSYAREPKEIRGQIVKIAYSVILCKKTPFTPKQVKKYVQFCNRKKQKGGKYKLSYAPGVEGGEQEFVNLMAAVSNGSESEFYRSYHYDLSPISDDKPFFFRYHRWKHLFDKLTAPNYQGVIGEDPVGLYILLSVLFETLLLVALLVILPLFVFRRKGLKTIFSGRIIFYFFALGISYMFIEIASMQKFVLFLGHPTYSLSIVLFSFLLFSGIGSLYGKRFEANPTRGISLAIVAIFVILVIYQFILPSVFAWGLSFTDIIRMIISVCFLAPIAFFMGMPFPLGMHIINRHCPEMVPWAFGINGGASVISSVVSIIIAMETGFTTVFLIAGLIYLAAGFFFKKIASTQGQEA